MIRTRRLRISPPRSDEGFSRLSCDSYSPGSSSIDDDLSTMQQTKRQRVSHRNPTPQRIRLAISVSFIFSAVGILLLIHLCIVNEASSFNDLHRMVVVSLFSLHSKPAVASIFLQEFPSISSCNYPPSTVDFTLVAQCSEDRLWMMEYQCKQWHGPISLAVYTNLTVAQVKARLFSLHCQPTQFTVTVITADRSTEDYPVNELRNMAFSTVRTSHIVYIDIDFWIARNLRDVLAFHAETLANDPLLALVLPAFALKRQCQDYIECPSLNIPRMPRTKNDIFQGLLNRSISAFDPTNFGGHGSTHYAAWMGQEDEFLEPINCVFSNRYEPYLVVRNCDLLPPFQPVFTGYGKNKMTWIMQLRRQGFHFAQLNSFVCHYPHTVSASRLAWVLNTTTGKNALRRPKNPSHFSDCKRGRNDKLFVEFKHWLYNDVEDRQVVGLCENHADDDSKLWVDRRTSPGQAD